MFRDHYYYDRQADDFFGLLGVILVFLVIIGIAFWLHIGLFFIPGIFALILLVKWHDIRPLFITGIILATIQVVGIIVYGFYCSITGGYQSREKIIIPDIGKTAYIILNNEEFNDFEAYDFKVSVNGKARSIKNCNPNENKRSPYTSISFIIPYPKKDQKQEKNRITLSYTRKGKMASRREYCSVTLDNTKTKLFYPARFLYSNNELVQYESNYSLFDEDKNPSTLKTLEGMECFEEYLLKNPNKF